jgi:hypothetical protein
MGPDPSKLVQLRQHAKIMDTTYEAYVKAKETGDVHKLAEAKKVWNAAKTKYETLLKTL